MNYGYARVSRGRDGGTDTLQNQRMRLTGAGVAAAHIHQDIITGTAMQRPGLDGLPNDLQSGDALVVTALDRLGRDTLGLLELINGLATLGVALKVMDMPAAASRLLWSPPEWRPSSGPTSAGGRSRALSMLGRRASYTGGAGASPGLECTPYNGCGRSWACSLA